jgi:uncharacterized membrane protein (Fun14 family)
MPAPFFVGVRGQEVVMNIENIMWQIVLPLVVGFATGFWVRAAIKTSISIVFTLVTIAFGVFLWEAYTHQPTLLEGLGVTQRPDPIQQTLVLAKAALGALADTIVSLPRAAVIGFVAGVTAAITRAITRKPKMKTEHRTE